MFFGVGQQQINLFLNHIPKLIQIPMSLLHNHSEPRHLIRPIPQDEVVDGDLGHE